MASTSMRPNGENLITLESYDDVEDSIHEIHDDMWIMANSVGANEPLQAKQQWAEIMTKINALGTYIQALKDPEDDTDAVRTSGRSPAVQGNAGKA